MSLSRKKTNTEYIPLVSKDWRDAGPEIERLGQRIDVVRDVVQRLTESDQKWAVRYWLEAEAQLLHRWKIAVDLQHCGARESSMVRNTTTSKIDYSWWEPAQEISMSFPVIDNITRWVLDHTGNTDLTRAWEMAREEKLQKARQGQA
jgi:creatinine amidohydrolase/Fe(II)-dependent formamide hydrolase-like protein